MYNGHWSHQVGLDADIWLTPMPDHMLSIKERAEMMATNVVADDWKDINPKIWSQKYIDLLKTAAKDPEVERVLVNPAIKRALCRGIKGDRSWLHKIRPYWGHNWHFHVRIRCPKDSPGCRPQPAPPHDEGCGKGHCHINSAESGLGRAVSTATPRRKPLPTRRRSQREAV